MLSKTLAKESVDLTKEFLTTTKSDRSSAKRILDIRDAYLNNSEQLKHQTFNELEILVTNPSEETRAAAIHTIWLFKLHNDPELLSKIISIYAQGLKDPSNIVRDDATFCLATLIENGRFPNHILDELCKCDKLIEDLKNITEYGKAINPSKGFEPGGASDFAASILNALP